MVKCNQLYSSLIFQLRIVLLTVKGYSSFLFDNCVGRRVQSPIRKLRFNFSLYFPQPLGPTLTIVLVNETHLEVFLLHI